MPFLHYMLIISYIKVSPQLKFQSRICFCFLLKKHIFHCAEAWCSFNEVLEQCYVKYLFGTVVLYVYNVLILGWFLSELYHFLAEIIQMCIWFILNDG